MALAGFCQQRALAQPEAEAALSVLGGRERQAPEEGEAASRPEGRLSVNGLPSDGLCLQESLEALRDLSAESRKQKQKLRDQGDVK